MWEWFSRSVLTKGKRPKTSEAQGIMGKERKAKRKGEAQGRSARAKRKGEAPVANLYHPTVLRARRRERRLGVWVKKQCKETFHFAKPNSPKPVELSRENGTTLFD